MRHSRLASSFTCICVLSGLCALASADPPRVGQAPGGLALGVFGGHLLMDNQRDGDDINAVGHYAMTDAVSVEAELGVTEYHAGDRRDRRAGIGLVTWLRPAHRWSPHLALGVGLSWVTLPDYKLDARQVYGEVGGGVTIAVHDRVSIAGELRAGMRRLNGGSAEDAVITVVFPVEHRERYARARLAAMVRF